MPDQQCLIDEYELLRRQSLERSERDRQRMTLALRAVVDGGMFGFIRCCNTLLRTRPAPSKTVKPMRQVTVPRTTLPSAELTHALAGMVLTIVSQELQP